MGRKKAHTPARRDRGEAQAGRGADGAGQGGGRGGAVDRRHRADLRDELLRAEVFGSLREAQVLIEQWRRHYNTARPHSSLGYRPPAPEVVTPALPMPPPRPGSAGAAPPPAAMLH